MDNGQLTVDSEKNSFGFQVQSFEFQVSGSKLSGFKITVNQLSPSALAIAFSDSTVLQFYDSTIFQLSESRLPAGRQGLFRLHGLHGFLKCSNCHRYLPSLSPFPITQLHNYTITQLHDSTVLQFYNSTSLD